MWELVLYSYSNIYLYRSALPILRLGLTPLALPISRSGLTLYAPYLALILALSI